MAATCQLYVVTLLATHRKKLRPKRWATLNVHAASWTDAAVSQAVLDAESRLVAEDESDEYWIEIRVYLANTDGAAEGLAVGREDGGICR